MTPAASEVRPCGGQIHFFARGNAVADWRGAIPLRGVVGQFGFGLRCTMRCISFYLI